MMEVFWLAILEKLQTLTSWSPLRNVSLHQLCLKMEESTLTFSQQECLTYIPTEFDSLCRLDKPSPHLVKLLKVVPTTLYTLFGTKF